MEPWRKNLSVLIVGNFVASASFSLVMPFLPLFLRELGVTEGLETWSGAAFAATFVTGAIMSPVWGSLADRYGRKVMVLRSGICIGAIYVLMAAVRDPYSLVALRLLNGALSGFIPSAVALVATTAPDDRLGGALGRLQMAAPAGMICGPVLGGALQQVIGLRATMVIAGAAVWAVTALVWWSVREPFQPVKGPRDPISADLSRCLADPVLRAIILMFMLGSSAATMVQPILALLVERLGVTSAAPLAAGFIYSLVGIAAVVSSPWWGRQGERFGYRSALTAALATAAALALPQGFVRDVWSFSLLRFGFGLGLAGMNPLGHVVLALAAGHRFRGRAFGLANSFWMIGGALGPLAGGLVAERVGYPAVFVATALLMAAVAGGVHQALPVAVGPGEREPGAQAEAVEGRPPRLPPTGERAGPQASPAPPVGRR